MRDEGWTKDVIRIQKSKGKGKKKNFQPPDSLRKCLPKAGLRMGAYVGSWQAGGMSKSPTSEPNKISQDKKA